MDARSAERHQHHNHHRPRKKEVTRPVTECPEVDRQPSNDGCGRALRRTKRMSLSRTVNGFPPGRVNRPTTVDYVFVVAYGAKRSTHLVSFCFFVVPDDRRCTPLRSVHHYEHAVVTCWSCFDRTRSRSIAGVCCSARNEVECTLLLFFGPFPLGEAYSPPPA